MRQKGKAKIVHDLPFRELIKILEAIAKKYPESSEEFRSIELATKAVIFLYQHDLQRKFLTFVSSFGADLTEEQKSQLSKYGINLNE